MLQNKFYSPNLSQILVVIDQIHENKFFKNAKAETELGQCIVFFTSTRSGYDDELQCLSISVQASLELTATFDKAKTKYLKLEATHRLLLVMVI